LYFLFTGNESAGNKNDAAIPTSLVGAQEQAAKTQLESAGFRNIKTKDEYSDKDKGTVVSVSPDQGKTVPKTTQVTLTVSKGPQTAPVPDVRGFSPAEAVATIKAAGFKPVTQRQDTSDPNEDNVVISESPEQNTQASLGTPVTLTIGHYLNPGPTGPTGPTGP
jgi:serine/threonine-protein kinase